MALDKQQSHRPGALKQSNKGHKHGKHKSKGAISAAAKGKVSVITITKNQKKELNKQQRRNQATQIRKEKRYEVLCKKRSLGGYDYAPVLVCILPLNKDYDPAITILKLTQCDSSLIVNRSPTGVLHISMPRVKERVAFLVPPVDNEFAILDAMKISNSVLFMISAENGINFDSEAIDSWGKNLLLSCFGQGLPTPCVALTDLDNIPVKKRNGQKQVIQKQVQKWFPDEKVIPLEKEVDYINLLRKIGNQKRKAVIYRDRRPHLYAEDIEYSSSGTLKITGFLRGTRLSVNDLIYIPGLGTYQMSQIDAPVDPYCINRNKDTDAETVKVLDVENPAKQESLVSENIPDPMDIAQSLPTGDELNEAEQNDKKQKVKKKPKGWSNYQAAWIPYDDSELLSDDSEEESDDYVDAMSEDKSEYSDAENEVDTVAESEIALNDQQYDEQLDIAIEQSDLEKIKAAKMDLMFPDEIDTPQDIPARERFKKYIGLESFRTSPWRNKYLPRDYARIFRFKNFDHTRNCVLKNLATKEGVGSGLYIIIHVKNVPETLWRAFSSTGNPLVAFGLLENENKMSLSNVVLQRTNLFNEPLKSKEKLIFQCGYRRYIVNPIFSQHTNGDKHKFERFFQPNATTIATFFAPIQYGPSPVLCYKEINGSLVLVAVGRLLPCNPDRIILKRVVLSGHLFKVHKRSAVVRFMFFNREDILYYKPCKLHTKYGSCGHIKEPLGTHGHMKCVFNKHVKSQDTVLLNLYKRVFPKWTFEECIVSCPSTQGDNSMDL